MNYFVTEYIKKSDEFPETKKSHTLDAPDRLLSTAWPTRDFAFIAIAHWVN